MNPTYEYTTRYIPYIVESGFTSDVKTLQKQRWKIVYEDNTAKGVFMVLRLEVPTSGHESENSNCRGDENSGCLCECGFQKY